MADRAKSLTDGATVSVALLVMLARYARDAGLDVPVDAPVGAEARMPTLAFLDAWERVRAESSDIDFGLHVGEYLRRVGDQHAVGQLLVVCDTVKQALDKLCEYHGLLVEPVTVHLEDGRLWLEPSLGERHLTESVFANLAGTITRLADEVEPLEKVCFCHAEPDSTDEHSRLFPGAELCFSAPRDEITLAESILGRTLPLPNPELRELLETYVRRARDRLLSERRVSRHVAEVIGRLLPEGRPTLTTVARAMAQSPRALQGRLADEGTRFQTLLDEVRRDVARAALRESDLPLADVASMVGFADQSAFQRSYKRWTGMTPGQERSNGCDCDVAGNPRNAPPGQRR